MQFETIEQDRSILANGWVLSRRNMLPKPVLTMIPDALWHHHNEYTLQYISIVSNAYSAELICFCVLRYRYNLPVTLSV